jgi:hypothetical protein
VPSSARLELLPPQAASGSLDHGKSNTHWGADFGTIYTVVPKMAPVTGAKPIQNTSPVLPFVDGSEQHDQYYYMHTYPSYAHPTPFPEVEFHKFDGRNPKLWVKRWKLNLMCIKLILVHGFI